ncbi:MAG: DNA polymerase I, partial [Alphaproteobacteria bacterium]|nr:DNA polymerase I [Alphaproteobacteria bacterium]
MTTVATPAGATASGPRRLYLVDGSGFIFRAYHSLPPLTRPDGTPVGAVYGFTNMLLKLFDGLHADYAAVIFDAARKTFRNDIYPEYKAHRPPAPEDLIPQFPLVREATVALGLPAIEMEGFEADDIIATYAKQGREQGFEVVIVSSDKDLMQLITDGVALYDAMKSKRIGEAEVLEKFGVPPSRVVDAQALIGDSSDNVPGIPGIGPKTAAELINTFGSLDAVLERAGEIKQQKRRENIIANADKARMSRALVKLRDDVPLPITIDAMEVKPPNAEQFIRFAEAQGFKALIAQFQKKMGVIPPPAGGRLGGGHDNAPASHAGPPPILLPAGGGVPRDYRLVQDVATLTRWIAEARAAGWVAFDTETTSLDAKSAALVGFSLCIEPGKACYVPVGHTQPQAQANLFGEVEDAKNTKPLKQIPRDEALALLKPLLEDASVLKIGQNIKYDMLVLRQYGVNISPVDDTMLLSYVLDSALHRHNMDELSERTLGIKPIAYKDVTGTGKSQISFAEVSLDKACDYAAEDADITLQLHRVLKPRLLAEHMVTVYERLERPLIPVLVAMEDAGVKVDKAVLADLSRDFSVRIAALEKEIYALAGREFTIGSPKQLGEVLFDELKLGDGKKGKSGSYGTGADILEELAEEGHAFPAKVLEWRQFSKLKSTYTDALIAQIHPKTGRVHTSYAMAITSTGRLSSTDPNLQNIPIRTEEGRKIRKAFIAEQGNVLLSADYSQIELRLLADMAGIDTLKEAFRHGADIHALTAHQVFGVPLAQVDADLRRKAKTINFGIIYGMSAFGLAAQLGIGRQESAAYIEAYLAQYPGIRAYMEKT